MRHNYPDPQEVGFRTPPHLLSARFRAGFQHALEGGQLNKVEYFRLSFREGFRAAKLYLRHARRARGILDFPLRGRIRLKAIYR